MALADAARDLPQHRVGATAPRSAAHERDHAEVARERAAVLHLDECAHAVEARVSLYTADRAHVAGDERGRLLAPLCDDEHVARQAAERFCREICTAAGDVDARVGTRCARRFLARLRKRLVRDAARVHDRDLCAVVALAVPVGEQALPHLVRVDVRDLAAEKADREARHGPEC